MKILIFGGAGFIGSHVCDLLCGRNEIFVYDDLSTGKLENIQHLLSCKSDKFNFELNDIRNTMEVQSAFDRFCPEIVILLAAQAAITTSYADPRYDMDVNVGGMMNVIKAARACHTQQIIFSSTSAVYKEKSPNFLKNKLRERDECVPESPYAISKLAAENYLRKLFPDSIILRFGNVYGPRQVPIGENQVIPRMIRHFMFGDDFKIFGDGKQTRDYVFVEDVAFAVAKSMFSSAGTYNISTGKRLSVNGVAEILEGIYGVEGYRWEHRELPDDRKDICMDPSLAFDRMGWQASIPFGEGMRRTVDWWKAKMDGNDKVEAVKQKTHKVVLLYEDVA